MQYNQPMIDLVYAIRNHLSDADKCSIKTTNPELLDDLADIYRKSSDAELCKHIEALLRLAGSTWLDLLRKGQTVGEVDWPNGKIVQYMGKSMAGEAEAKPEITGPSEAKVLKLAPLTGKVVNVAFR